MWIHPSPTVHYVKPMVNDVFICRSFYNEPLVQFSFTKNVYFVLDRWWRMYSRTVSLLWIRCWICQHRLFCLMNRWWICHYQLFSLWTVGDLGLILAGFRLIFSHLIGHCSWLLIADFDYFPCILCTEQRMQLDTPIVVIRLGESWQWYQP